MKLSRGNHCCKVASWTIWIQTCSSGLHCIGPLTHPKYNSALYLFSFLNLRKSLSSASCTIFWTLTRFIALCSWPWYVIIKCLSSLRCINGLISCNGLVSHPVGLEVEKRDKLWHGEWPDGEFTYFQFMQPTYLRLFTLKRSVGHQWLSSITFDPGLSFLPWPRWHCCFSLVVTVSPLFLFPSGFQVSP